MDDFSVTAVNAVKPVKPVADIRTPGAVPSSRDPQPSPAVAPPTESQMVASANAFESALANRNLHLRFRAEGTQIVTELIDETTGKLINRIPAGRLSDMLASGSSDFSGLFIDAVG
jgi:hypothetical protein